jgi:hypothetical protein
VQGRTTLLTLKQLNHIFSSVHIGTMIRTCCATIMYTQILIINVYQCTAVFSGSTDALQSFINFADLEKMISTHWPLWHNAHQHTQTRKPLASHYRYF